MLRKLVMALIAGLLLAAASATAAQAGTGGQSVGDGPGLAVNLTR